MRTFWGNGWLAEVAHLHTECLGGLGSATDIARLEHLAWLLNPDFLVSSMDTTVDCS